MNQQSSDQEWQRLQHRISCLLNRYLMNEIQAIEHNSNVAGLLQAQSECLDSPKIENVE